MTYPHFLHPLLLITDYILIIRISMAFIQCLLHAHFCVFSHQNCHHFNPYPPVTYGDGALTEVTHGPCHVPCFTAWHCVALRGTAWHCATGSISRPSAHVCHRTSGPKRYGCATGLQPMWKVSRQLGSARGRSGMLGGGAMRATVKLHRRFSHKKGDGHPLI